MEVRERDSRFFPGFLSCLSIIPKYKVQEEKLRDLIMSIDFGFLCLVWFQNQNVKKDKRG